MTNASDESGATEGESTTGITDDQLPDDLVPGEDNPLAEPLPDGESMDLGVPEPGEQPGEQPGGEDKRSEESDSEG